MLYTLHSSGAQQMDASPSTDISLRWSEKIEHYNFDAKAMDFQYLDL